MPSLDAGDGSMFNAVNRPHADIAFEQVLEGLIAFRDEYRGQFRLEVFLPGGHTAFPADARKIAECVGRIKPDQVQGTYLRALQRPGVPSIHRRNEHASEKGPR